MESSYNSRCPGEEKSKRGRKERPVCSIFLSLPPSGISTFSSYFDVSVFVCYFWVFYGCLIDAFPLLALYCTEKSKGGRKGKPVCSIFLSPSLWHLTFWSYFDVSVVIYVMFWVLLVCLIDVFPFLTLYCTLEALVRGINEVE